MSALLNRFHMFLLRRWAKRLEQDAEYHKKACFFHRKASLQHADKALEVRSTISRLCSLDWVSLRTHTHTEVDPKWINDAEDEIAKRLGRGCGGHDQ